MTTKLVDPEVQATMDSINASLGISLGKKKPAKRVSMAKKLPEKWNEWQEANRIAYILLSRNIWKPIAMVSHCITQTCDCCNSEVTFIGNLFIRHKHRDSMTTWDYPMPLSELYASLPRIYNETMTTVPECAKCFRCNTFQATGKAITVDGADITMFHTCLWCEQIPEVQDDFFEEKPNGDPNGETPESKPTNGSAYPTLTRDFNALKYAIPRPSDATLDLRDQKPDNRESDSGVL